MNNGEPSRVPGPCTTKATRRSAICPSAWDIVHDRGLTTSLYASKTKFVIFEQSYDSGSGAADTTGADNGQ